MAVILAYTSPAIGHLFPFCALLGELASRGHQIHVRTLDSGADLCRQLGFAALPVDPRIEAIQGDDWTTGSAKRSAGMTYGPWCGGRRSRWPISRRRSPTSDPTCSRRRELLWSNFGGRGPTHPLAGLQSVRYLREGPGSPPFGPGFAPRAGALGWIRHAGVKS